MSAPLADSTSLPPTRILRSDSHVDGLRRDSSLARLVGGARTCGACHPQGECGTAGEGTRPAPIYPVTFLSITPRLSGARQKGSLPSWGLQSNGTNTNNRGADSNFMVCFLVKFFVLNIHCRIF